MFQAIVLMVERHLISALSVAQGPSADMNKLLQVVGALATTRHLCATLLVFFSRLSGEPTLFYSASSPQLYLQGGRSCFRLRKYEISSIR